MVKDLRSGDHPCMLVLWVWSLCSKHRLSCDAREGTGYSAIGNARLLEGLLRDLEAIYIATLQQSIAAHSDCLILMGGGSFQQLTAVQHIHSHGKACFHTVCMGERWEDTFNSICRYTSVMHY